MTYPTYYQCGSCFYMITGERQYVRVTLYEAHNQYGISTDVVLPVAHIAKHGKQTNQHEFNIAYAKAQSQLNKTMGKYLPERTPVIEIPY